MRIQKSLFILLICLMTGSLALASGSFKLPDYEKFVLKNGLTVYLMEQHEVPLVYVSLVFPAGGVKDGAKNGLAAITADALLFGTKNYTKTQIEETLDYIGASFGTSASLETAGLTMSFVNKDQATVFPILKEIVTMPVFDEQEFEKRKKRLLTELELARERPSSVIGAYYNKFLFGDHVYGNPVSGTKASVESISLNDVKQFYQANYLPNGSAIAIVGDFKTEEMKKAVIGLFQGWKKKELPKTVEKETIPAMTKTRLLLVNKDDATETRFLIGGLGIKRSDPDYVAVQVINTILGGRFTSWLNDELRVNRGLTYGARSYFNEYKDNGSFVMSSFTRTEKTVEALDVALEVYDKLIKQGVDEATLTSAKNYIKGQYPPRFETGGRLAGLLNSMFVYDFDESFINNFQKNVDEMTVSKASEIVQKHFPQENLQFVLIGKADEIREQVQKYGDVTEKEIKADGF